MIYCLHLGAHCTLLCRASILAAFNQSAFLPRQSYCHTLIFFYYCHDQHLNHHLLSHGWAGTILFVHYRSSMGCHTDAFQVHTLIIFTIIRIIKIITIIAIIKIITIIMIIMIITIITIITIILEREKFSELSGNIISNNAKLAVFWTRSPLHKLSHFSNIYF